MTANREKDDDTSADEAKRSQKSLSNVLQKTYNSMVQLVRSPDLEGFRLILEHLERLDDVPDLIDELTEFETPVVIETTCIQAHAGSDGCSKLHRYEPPLLIRLLLWSFETIQCWPPMHIQNASGSQPPSIVDRYDDNDAPLLHWLARMLVESIQRFEDLQVGKFTDIQLLLDAWEPTSLASTHCISIAVELRRRRHEWLNSVDRSNRNVIHWLAMNRDSEANVFIAKLLIDSGAEPFRGDNKGQNPWHAAAMTGNLRMMALLMEVASARDVQKEINRPRGGNFIDCIDENGEVMVKTHLEEENERLKQNQEADEAKAMLYTLLGSRDNNGCTALHWAAFKDRTLVVQFLANISSPMHLPGVLEWDDRDCKGMTPLHRAAQGNAHQVLDLKFFEMRQKYTNGELTLDEIRTPLLLEDFSGHTLKRMIQNYFDLEKSRQSLLSKRNLNTTTEQNLREEDDTGGSSENAPRSCSGGDSLENGSSLEPDVVNDSLTPEMDIDDIAGYGSISLHEKFIAEQTLLKDTSTTGWTASLSTLLILLLRQVEGQSTMIGTLTICVVSTLLYHYVVKPTNLDSVWWNPTVSSSYHSILSAALLYGLFPLTWIICDPENYVQSARSTFSHAVPHELASVIGANFRLMFTKYRYFSTSEAGSALWCWRPVRHLNADRPSSRLTDHYLWKLRQLQSIHDAGEKVDHSSLNDGDKKYLVSKWPLEAHCRSREFDPSAICYTCWNYKPMRTKHCRTCDECFPVLDHHCDWIGRCVSHKNHRLFVFWLAWIITADVYMIEQTTRKAFRCFRPLPSTSTFPISTLYRTSMAVIWMTPTLLYIWALVLIGAIFIDQVMGVFWNITVNERLNLENHSHYPYFKWDGVEVCKTSSGAFQISSTELLGANPFDKGIVQNTIDFIFARRHEIDDNRLYRKRLRFFSKDDMNHGEIPDGEIVDYSILNRHDDTSWRGALSSGARVASEWARCQF